MPRIVPIQLLNCLSVLLSPEGGIKSTDEVERLVKLMTKYSRKLVSKCIYIQILKCTETDLLGLFMGSEGWLLVHQWLTESIAAKNWPLVKELLELLLLCPVDIERLKTNNCPKLVKELSKDEDHFAIRALASKLVEQWLKTVKGEHVVPIRLSDIPQIINDAQPDSECVVESNTTKTADNILSKTIKEENHTSDVNIKIEEEPETLPVLKICLKEEKQVISAADGDNETSDSEKSKDKSRSNKDKTDDKSNRSTRSSNSSKHSSWSQSNVIIKKESSVESNADRTVHSLENKTNKDEHMKLEKSSDISENHISDVNLIKEDPETLPVLKISLKDDKQVITTADDDNESKASETSDSEKSKERSKSSKDKSSRSSRSSSSKHLSRSNSSSDKHKRSHKSSSSHHSSSHKEKSKDKDKSKERHSSSSKLKSDSSRKSSDKSSSSSKSNDRSSTSSDKDRHKERNKEEKNKRDSLNKSTEKSDLNKSTEKNDGKSPPSIHKLGKIPKLSDLKKEKPSISIEVRKPDEPKPKTVKTFHSKFRKHGLEEEVKPPPSRAAVLTKKATPVLPPVIPVPKRPSPVHNDPPPEKKPKIIEPVEKPGAIKLIPPKPKHWLWWHVVPSMSSSVYHSLGSYFSCAMLLLESDMFMDALNASATNKKDPKKRKRRTSCSKDGNPSSDGSPPHTPNSITSPNSESKSVPPRFYQDTLETEDNKEKVPEKSPEVTENVEQIINEKMETEEPEKMDTSEPHTLTVNGLKGVLCYHKRKGPKKSIKWKPEGELEEIQYFELDETERVNVTKTFTDMKYLERIHERDAFQKGRNLSNDDVMEEKTNWRPLIPVDGGGQIHVEHGKNSKEKDIQAIRQKGTLQPLYFSKAMIPDSALEPDTETHPYSEPTIIPLEDVTGNQDNISDFRNMPWPEPRGNAPPPSTNVNVPALFPSNMNQFPNSFPTPQFPGVPPGFQGGAMVSSEWPSGLPPHMLPNGMPGPMPPHGAIPPGNMPGIMMPPENMMIPPEIFGGPNPMFPVPPDGFNMQQNMFPMDFNMAGPQGPDSFPPQGNFRGAIRGRGAGGHWRGKNGGNWEGSQRGRGGPRGGRKAVCIYFQRKGSCRQGDNCSFLHPGVNCPF